MQTSVTFGTAVLAYLAALAALTVLDGLWLGWVAKSFYATEMGALMNESPRIVPAALFYLLYPAALTLLLLWHGTPASVGQAVLQAAVLGFMAYGTYDATNLAVLKGFSMRMALVDVVWGTFATAMAGWALAATAAARSAP
ncbi:DUF2177 family protein [Comamonadaceae bacterium PP-2]